MNAIQTFAAVTLLVVPALGATPQSADAKIEQAVAAYNEAFESDNYEQRVRLFRRAEILFEQLTESDHDVGPELYVNLGNAALGAQRIGPAILAYQKSLVLDPDHRRARQNIEHARTLLPNWVPKPEPHTIGFNSFFDWISGLAISETLGLAAFAFLIVAILLACSIRWRRPGLRNFAFLPAAVWIGLMATALWSSTSEKQPVAVIVRPETIARSADSINSPPRLPEPLPSGTEVQIIEDRNDWVRVRFYDGRDAWIPSSSIEVVAI